jgi:hypothetical protein
MNKLARLLRLISFFVVALVVVSFAVSNRGMVTLFLQPLPVQVTLPLYLFGLFVLLLGFIWGATHSLAERFSKHLQIRDDKRQIEALRAEILSLRAENSSRASAAVTEGNPSPLASLAVMPITR